MQANLIIRPEDDKETQTEEKEFAVKQIQTDEVLALTLDSRQPSHQMQASLSLSKESSAEVEKQAAAIKELTSKLAAVRQQNDQLREHGAGLAEDIKEYEKNTVTLENELNYQQLRERKILYLVHLLQSRGYPV